MSIKMKCAAYADMFAPATGDRVRLADTDLVVEVVISPSPVKRQSACVGEIARFISQKGGLKA